MPSKISAGLLMCKRGDSGWEFLLAHPGGPFFVRKDAGFWSIPKGLVDPDEDYLLAAKREFAEETGLLPSAVTFVPLGHVVQSGGKRVHAWAFEGSWDPASLVSNTFELEWPPRSGKRRVYPEVDRAAFFVADEARLKLMPAQAPFIERALAALGP